MDICQIVSWFGLFSVLGWVYECTYCAIKNRKWDNRGFLFGPVCPIYGFGASFVIIAASVLPKGSQDTVWWQVFLASAAGSAVLEYSTSWVLEKFFHARWWDYSNIPLNLNGRICLPFALCFGTVGCLLYYFVFPFVSASAPSLPQYAWELIALATAGLMSADLALTLSALTDLTKRVERGRNDFDAVMETAVDNLASGRHPLEHDLEAAAKHTAQELSSMQKRALRNIRTHTEEYREASAERLRHALEKAEEQKRKR